MKNRCFIALLAIMLGLLVYNIFTNLFDNPILELIYYTLMCVLLAFNINELKRLNKPLVVTFGKIGLLLGIVLTIVKFIQIL